LEEDKRALEKEKARIPNQHDVDDKLKNLRKECDDLKRQIGQKKSEINDQNILLGDRKKKFTITAKQHEELVHSVDTLEVKLLSSIHYFNSLIFSVGVHPSHTSTCRIT
jgi:chromosome segregation ATPase